MSRKIGEYIWSNNELPAYRYTGDYPACATDREGRDSMEPADPCFILGNNRLTAFAHVSGQIELITGERGWARINNVTGNSYYDHASIEINGSKYLLAGEKANINPSDVLIFGTGFASYKKEVSKDCTVTRRISVRPSERVNDGIPALIFEVRIENTGANTLNVSYTEKIAASYCMLSAQANAFCKKSTVSYTATAEPNDVANIIEASFEINADGIFAPAESEKERHPYDCFPPVFYLKAASGMRIFDESPDGRVMLCCEKSTEIEPGEDCCFEFVAGLLFEQDNHTEQIKVMQEGRTYKEDGGAYSKLWRRCLPDFSGEDDEDIRWEMIWNAYTLYAMANYHGYFDDTTVPQGSVYAYRLGQNTSVRDHLQHSMAMAYLAPDIAKSGIRFVLKHMCFDGRITRQDIGFGYEDKDIYMESDPQLYLFLAVSEYLRITGDHGFLNEIVSIYPAEEKKERTVLKALVDAFIWLRDMVCVGRHGLLMMRNSDWSDSFFHTYSPNLYAQVAESHMNTTMALFVLPALSEQLERGMDKTEEKELSKQLLAELKTFADCLLEAFYKDLGDRIYAPRCYIGFDDSKKLRFGEDRLCIEAQIWLLLIPSFPMERKERLWREIKELLIEQEKLGARTRERPLWRDDEGTGEDGGMWYAHQGPLMVGAAQISKEEAFRLFKRLTFHHFAEAYPDYWVGHWTAPDAIESSLSKREGLYLPWVDNAVWYYNAHPHAWMLYCYYRLFNSKEGKNDEAKI